MDCAGRNQEAKIEPLQLPDTQQSGCQKRKPRAEPMDGIESTGKPEKARSSKDDDHYFPNATAVPVAANTSTSEQPELPPGSNQLAGALNLIVAALPVQESGS